MDLFVIVGVTFLGFFSLYHIAVDSIRRLRDARLRVRRLSGSRHTSALNPTDDHISHFQGRSRVPGTGRSPARRHHGC